MMQATITTTRPWMNCFCFGHSHLAVLELHKVEWPKQRQLVQGTVVVIVACIIVGTFLYINDEIWKNVVQKILIK